MLLSGCAAYPLPLSCDFNLPWAVSRREAASEALSIRSWARAPHRFDPARLMAGWIWLGPWAIRTWQTFAARLFLFGGLAGGVTALTGVRVSRTAKVTFAALCLCLAYWFWSAPDIRFGSGYLAAAGVLGLSVACAAYFYESDALRRLTVEAVAVSALIGAAGLAQSGNT